MSHVNVFDIHSGGEKVLCRTNQTAVRRDFSLVPTYIEHGNTPHGRGWSYSSKWLQCVCHTTFNDTPALSGTYAEDTTMETTVSPTVSFGITGSDVLMGGEATR